MLVEAGDTTGGKAKVTNLLGSFLGNTSGNHFRGRASIWLHHLRGRGYIAREYSLYVAAADAYYFSPDGLHWTTITKSYWEPPYLYGDRVITNDADQFVVTAQPTDLAIVRPLVMNSGGTNLLNSSWQQVGSPGSGNEIHAVSYVEGQYVYTASGEPLDVQPESLPPVAADAQYWEVRSEGIVSNAGTYVMSSMPSELSQRHLITSWHYSLDGDGIDPGFSLGDYPTTNTRWVANTHWVPNYRASTPVADGPIGLPRITSHDGRRGSPQVADGRGRTGTSEPVDLSIAARCDRPRRTRGSQRFRDVRQLDDRLDLRPRANIRVLLVCRSGRHGNRAPDRGNSGGRKHRHPDEFCPRHPSTRASSRSTCSPMACFRTELPSPMSGSIAVTAWECCSPARPARWTRRSSRTGTMDKSAARGSTSSNRSVRTRWL